MAPGYQLLLKSTLPRRPHVCKAVSVDKVSHCLPALSAGVTDSSASHEPLSEVEARSSSLSHLVVHQQRALKNWPQVWEVQ